MLWDENISQSYQEKEERKRREKITLDVNKANYKEKLSSYSKGAHQFSIIHFQSLAFAQIKKILGKSGGNVKAVNISFDNPTSHLSSLDLIEVFNMMPNLERLEVHFHDYEIKYPDEKDSKKSKRQKLMNSSILPKLQSLHISTRTDGTSIYKFFTQHLAENSIVEHSIHNTTPHYRPKLTERAKTKLFNQLNGAMANFFGKQKSITKMISQQYDLLPAINMLTLDEIHIDKPVELQPQIKALTVDYCTAAYYEEICQLKHLEHLQISSSRSENFDFNLLQNLKRLKSFKYGAERLRNFDHIEECNPQWTSHIFESLEDLRINDYNFIATADVLMCFPNLKVLHVGSHLVVNAFLKFLPKLEELKLSYDDGDGTTSFYEIFETDTVIVNESLRALEITGDLEFWINAGRISEAHDSFPNLEVLKLDCNNWKTKHRSETTNYEKDIFDNFHQWTSLKVLKLGKISLQDYHGDFADIAEDLKKLARKLSKVKFVFDDVIKETDEREDFSYQGIIDGVKDLFEIEEFEPEEYDDETTYRLEIKSI